MMITVDPRGVSGAGRQSGSRCRPQGSTFWIGRLHPAMAAIAPPDFGPAAAEFTHDPVYAPSPTVALSGGGGAERVAPANGLRSLIETVEPTQALVWERFHQLAGVPASAAHVADHGVTF